MNEQPLNPPNEANEQEENVPFSQQPTSMVEATLAETLGLSMHNAIATQQSAQMTTSASITNACARLLQTPTHLPAEHGSDQNRPKLTVLPDKEQDISDVAVDISEDAEDEIEETPPVKKRFNLLNFLSRNKKSKQENDE